MKWSFWIRNPTWHTHALPALSSLLQTLASRAFDMTGFNLGHASHSLSWNKASKLRTDCISHLFLWHFLQAPQPLDPFIKEPSSSYFSGWWSFLSLCLHIAAEVTWEVKIVAGQCMSWPLRSGSPGWPASLISLAIRFQPLVLDYTNCW